MGCSISLRVFSPSAPQEHCWASPTILNALVAEYTHIHTPRAADAERAGVEKLKAAPLLRAPILF